MVLRILNKSLPDVWIIGFSSLGVNAEDSLDMFT